MPRPIIDVAIFEDRYPQPDLPTPEIPEGLVSWMREACAKIDLDVLPPEDCPLPSLEGDVRIELLLCGPRTMDETFGAVAALGLHVNDTPETDPFGDGGDYAEAFRILVVVDPDDIRKRLAGEIEADGHGYSFHLWEYEGSEASTAFHELAHVALFAANSGWRSPAEIDRMYSTGEVENDLFDFATGYGIRPLTDEDDEEVWAENAADAGLLMEEWCERQGKKWYREVEAQMGVGFFAAAGIDPDEPAP